MMWVNGVRVHNRIEVVVKSYWAIFGKIFVSNKPDSGNWGFSCIWQRHTWTDVCLVEEQTIVVCSEDQNTMTLMVEDIEVCLHTIPALIRITVHISVCSTGALCYTVSISWVVKLPLRTWFYHQETQTQKNMPSAKEHQIYYYMYMYMKVLWNYIHGYFTTCNQLYHTWWECQWHACCVKHWHILRS